MDKKNKSIVVRYETWQKLQSLNHNNGRKSIEDVITYLLNLQKEASNED